MRENDDTWVGNDDNPILLPHAAEALRAHNRFIHDGGYELSPWALCSPIGVPQILNLNEPVQFLQEEDMITVIYQRDHHVRRIHLNQDHPAGVAPSWYGHSVGHFEGDALVVDTIGLNGRAPLDRFGTRATAALHVVERYRKSEDGTLLIVDFTVEDPNTFALAWSARVSYAHSADSFEEHVCAENNKDAATGDDYPIPMAVRSDF
jgi:hypothetical protein